MALFFDGMPCALCHSPLATSDTTFGTWGVWLPESDRLHRFCDTVIHWSCYAEWKHRARFARSYFEFWVRQEQQDIFWWRAFFDDAVLVTVNPDAEVQSAWVCLAETGSRLSVTLSSWDAWVEDPTEAVHRVEQQAIDNAKLRLRRDRPTGQSLLSAINRSAKSELFRRVAESEQIRASEESRRREETAKHNALCEKVLPVILGAKYCCPSCHESRSNFRLSTREGSRSLIVCRQCGHVVDPQLFATSIPQSH